MTTEVLKMRPSSVFSNIEPGISHILCRIAAARKASTVSFSSGSAYFGKGP